MHLGGMGECGKRDVRGDDMVAVVLVVVVDNASSLMVGSDNGGE